MTEGRKEGSSRHAHRRERQEVRRERRKEGGRKKEKGADEAGKTSTELYQRLIPGCVYFVGLRRRYCVSGQVLALWTEPETQSFRGLVGERRGENSEEQKFTM